MASGAFYRKCLKFDFDWVLDSRTIFDFEKFLALEIEHASDQIDWKCLNLCVQVTNTAVIKSSRCLDLILGVDQLLLQLQKVLVCFEVWIGLSNREQAL